jgi:hypothetical protein
VLRILAGLAVLVTIVIQITDRLLNNAFDPSEYFSYFTIQSCLINIVVLLVGGVMAWRISTDTVLYTTVRMSTLAYAVVTAGVYNLLLRYVPYEGFQGLSWPNEVLHVWVPLFILLDWLFSPGRPALPWTALRVVIAFPIAWLAYTLIRGAFTAIYPYPFLDPATGGWPSVIAYIVGLSAFILAIGAFAILYSRGRSRIRSNTAPR